jgi:hypothetical protein
LISHAGQLAQLVPFVHGGKFVGRDGFNFARHSFAELAK